MSIRFVVSMTAVEGPLLTVVDVIGVVIAVADVVRMLDMLDMLSDLPGPVVRRARAKLRVRHR